MNISIFNSACGFLNCYGKGSLRTQKVNLIQYVCDEKKPAKYKLTIGMPNKRMLYFYFCSFKRDVNPCFKSRCL